MKSLGRFRGEDLTAPQDFYNDQREQGWMSPITEEDKARETIDNLLTKAGWRLFDVAKTPNQRQTSPKLHKV